VKRILIACSGLTAMVMGVPAPGLRARPIEPTARTVYVSVVDNKGVPLTDLTEADFAVKENGKDYAVKVELAKDPMQLAVIVDDNGTGVFRPGVAALVQGLLKPGTEVQIVTVLTQVTRVTEFTSNVDALRTAITSLVVRPGVREGGSLPVDGVLESLKDLAKKKAARPVAVIMTVGAADKSLAQSTEVLRELKQTMASFHAITLGNSLISSAASGMDQVNVNQMLDDGPKQSGGKRQSLTAPAAVGDAVKRLVDQLSNQYVLRYSLPDGVKMHERLQVSVKRQGATVLAPAKIADK
jgi:VWFA-related protein